MMEPSIEARLAEHALLPAARIPDSARAAAATTLLDTLSCVIAGLRSDECRALIALYTDGGRGEASVAGSASRIAATSAAMCNAAMAHWYEWDDLHDAAVIHASAVIWPALLATAEASGSTGTELVSAAVAAFDIAARIGEAITPYAHNGWYMTAPACAVGAAAGAARLRGLPVEGVRAAMGLAATAAELSRQTLLDRVNGKNALCAQTVNVAMVAVDLARAGIVGARNYLTGDYGFNAMMANNTGALANAVADLGTRFSIEAVSTKPFPCCRATHPLIDLAQQLRARHPGIADRIARVVLNVPQPTFDICGRPFTPGDNPRVAAQFSLAYTVALALRQGHVGLSDFEPDRVLADQAGQALASRIESVAFPLAPGQGQYDLPVQLECTLNDGGHLEIETSLAKGSPAYPLTVQERREKLLDCTQGALSAEDVDSLQEEVARVDGAGLSAIMAILRRAKSPSASGPLR